MKKYLLPILLLTALCIYSCQKDLVIKFAPDVVTEGYITDSIQSREDSVTLTGSATDKDGEVVAYLWSLVTGPNVPVIVTPGLPETQIASIIPGTYVFQLMATDNEGFTGVAMDTVVIIEKKHTETTITIKNDGDHINEMLIAGNQTTNLSDAGSPEIDAYNWTQLGSQDLGKGAFKFDLSQVPANATIKSAKLTLYSNTAPQNGNQMDANYGANNSIFIERITSEWNNNTTWQTQPSTDRLDHISIPQSNQSREDLIDIDVTSLVQKMISSTNYGFEIRLQQDNIVYNSRLFCGSRFSDVTKHPSLKVTF